MSSLSCISTQRSLKETTTRTVMFFAGVIISDEVLVLEMSKKEVVRDEITLE